MPLFLPAYFTVKMHIFYWTTLLVVTVTPTVVCEEYARCEVKLDLDVCDSSENIISKVCENAPVCRKHFNIVYMNHKPYSSHILNDTLRLCCGDCVSSSIVMNVSTMSGIKTEIMNTSHFVFPVLGRKYSTRLYGYWFLPMFETPNVYFITHKENNFMNNLVVSCLNMWPLFLLSAFLIIISGFLCWATEMWGNDKEFPKSFVSGWFEGIWWSFISMTTVGYGDKVPKSVCGRLLTIIWIIIGITSFSLITATLTSEIVAANSLPPPTIEHARVGLIGHHKYEGILVANQGGLLVSTDPSNLLDGIHDLIEMLHNQSIDGFVLDHYELVLFFKYFENDTFHQRDVAYIKQRTVLTQINKEENYVYGVLIRLEEDYHFLADFLSSNSDVLNTCSRLFLSMSSHKWITHGKVSLFSTKGEIFWQSVVACALLVMVCISFGGVYELRRKNHVNREACKRKESAIFREILHSQSESSP